MTHRSVTGFVAAVVLVAMSLSTAACSGDGTNEPVRDSREALGTFVGITAYGEDEPAIRAALDRAYAAMAEVEAATNAYDEDGEPILGNPTAQDPRQPARETTSVASFNRDPAGVLPDAVIRVLDAVEELGVGEEYSVSLLGVESLWQFEAGGRVPEAMPLQSATALASGFQTVETPQGLVGTFATLRGGSPDWVRVGLDLGGAAKGLALGAAVEALQEHGAVDAALVTAGSTTIAFGSKPDGKPWRIGVEDPRDPTRTVAAIESTGTVIVSTSGDYQRYFERDGIRYHHILDPATGMPAQGIQSLTVVGTDTGLDSDILSTALFVMGPADAMDYAAAHDLGLYIIDDRGRNRGQSLTVPGPEARTWEIIPQKRQ